MIDLSVVQRRDLFWKHGVEAVKRIVWFRASAVRHCGRCREEVGYSVMAFGVSFQINIPTIRVVFPFPFPFPFSVFPFPFSLFHFLFPFSLGYRRSRVQGHRPKGRGSEGGLISGDPSKPLIVEHTASRPARRARPAVPTVSCSGTLPSWVYDLS